MHSPIKLQIHMDPYIVSQSRCSAYIMSGCVQTFLLLGFYWSPPAQMILYILYMYLKRKKIYIGLYVIHNNHSSIKSRFVGLLYIKLPRFSVK